MLTRFQTLVLLACALAAPSTAPAAAGQSAASTEAERETLARVAALQEELERLLAALPPELRAEIRERLANGEPIPLPGGPDTTAVTDEPAVHEVAAVDEPEPEPPGPPAASPTGTPEGRTCNTLLLFDSNGDGEVTGADRMWRHLFAWDDRDQDGTISDKEVQHLYDLGVRSLPLHLRHHVDKKGVTGDVWIEEGEIRLQLLGRRRDGGHAVLLVAAGDLAEAEGIRLFGPEDEPLAGMQPFRPGLSLRPRDGDSLKLDCP